MVSKIETERRDLAIRLLNGQKPQSLRDDLVSSLSQRGLLTVLERHKGGTAKKVQLTAPGEVIAKFWEKEQCPD